MAFLLRAKKCDLRVLAKELGEVVTPDLVVHQLKTLITNSVNFEEESTSALYELVVQERLEEEERVKEERARLEEREREKEERAFELEKLRLTQAESGSRDSSVVEENPRDCAKKVHAHFQKLVPKFEPEKSDISLYLKIFERQANRVKINKNDWVSVLLGLLPLDIVQLIAREDDQEAEDYDHVKKLLLKRYKLSPEVFRQKFTQNQKKSDETWKDFAFETKNYLEEWLTGLQIDNFEKLKELMIVDQIKKRVNPEIKEHYLDKWSTITSVVEITGMLDNYEEVRKNRKKTIERNSNERTPNSPERRKDFRLSEKMKNSRSVTEARSDERSNHNFDRRKKLRCYECGSTEHLRPNCPEIKRSKTVNCEEVNNLYVKSDHKLLEPYLSEGYVDKHKINFLRDTGSTLDVVCKKYVSPDSYRGENIWVKQPLDTRKICLPLATVEISGDFGIIQTKAAVCADNLDEGRYILGNGTAALIKETTGYEFNRDEFLNQMKTKAQTRFTEENNPKSDSDKLLESSEPETPVNIQIVENDGSNIVNPDLDETGPELSVVNISKGDFQNAQEKCEALKGCSEVATAQGKNSESVKLITLKDGDSVLISETPKAINLSIQWIGRGKVEEEVSENNCAAEVSWKGERTQIYHIKILKPRYKRPESVKLITLEGIT